jgi:hypothetical protein
LHAVHKMDTFGETLFNFQIFLTDFYEILCWIYISYVMLSVSFNFKPYFSCVHETF